MSDPRDVAPDEDRDTPMLDVLVNEPSPFKTTSRTRHRILTAEEDATLMHIRNNCHDAKVCRLCAVSGAVKDSAERWQEMYYTKAAQHRAIERLYDNVKAERDQLKRDLDSIIEG